MLVRQLDPEVMGDETSELKQGLKRLIIGQDEAIETIVEIYELYKAKLNSTTKPISNVLMLGPTGSGKTRIVEATAEILFKNSKAMTKIDCAEFQHSHDIAKLIGSPPGYLGHKETHPALSNERLNQYKTEKDGLNLLLFDEIEKASDALWMLMLGIMDKATLTLGTNETVDFSNSIIFMTSNIGSKTIQQLKDNAWGFIKDASVNADIKSVGMSEVKKKFLPEFVNRLDKVVTFKQLTNTQIAQILDIETQNIQQRIFNSGNEFVLSFTKRAKELILKEALSNQNYGARELKRVLENKIVKPISKLLNTKQIHSGDLIRIRVFGEKFRFVVEEEGLTISQLIQLS